MYLLVILILSPYSTPCQLHHKVFPPGCWEHELTIPRPVQTQKLLSLLLPSGSHSSLSSFLMYSINTQMMKARSADHQSSLFLHHSLLTGILPCVSSHLGLPKLSVLSPHSERMPGFLWAPLSMLQLGNPLQAVSKAVTKLSSFVSLLPVLYYHCFTHFSPDFSFVIAG